MAYVPVDDIRQVFAILSPQIFHDWANLMRILGMPESEIQETLTTYRHKRPAEIVYKGLVRWEKMYGPEATVEKIVAGLQELKLNEIAETISKYRVNKKGVMWVPDETAKLNLANPRQRYRQLAEIVPSSREMDRDQRRLHLNSEPPLTFRRTTPSRSRFSDTFEGVPRWNDTMSPDRFSTESPADDERRHFNYTYVSSLVSPSKRFRNEPWYNAICFLPNNDLAILDKENKQIEIHACQKFSDCKRFVFHTSFKIHLEREPENSRPCDMTVFKGFIIIIDSGKRCLKVFTSDGKCAGSVKFKVQPKCISIKDGRAAIAFWDPSARKGSLVTYRANIETDRDGGRKFTLFDPKPILGVTNNYGNITLTDTHHIAALTEDGQLFLYGYRSPFDDTYVCRAVANTARLRSMTWSKGGVMVCNSYRDCIQKIPIKEKEPLDFDVSNSKTLLSFADGLYGPKTFAVFEPDDDFAVVNKFGAQVRVYGSGRALLKDKYMWYEDKYPPTFT